MAFKMVLLATFLSLLAFSISADADPIVPSWSSEIINDATASVSGADVSLSVYQTSYAAEIANLGILNGNYTLTFNYSFSAQEWWESPFIALVTNGAPAVALSSCYEGDLSCATEILNSEWDAGSPETAVSDIKTAAYSMSSPATGSITETFSAIGDTAIWFALVPSNYSANGDHAWTYFDIDNVSVSAIPEPGSFMLFSVGLGLIAACRLGTGRRRAPLTKSFEVD